MRQSWQGNPLVRLFAAIGAVLVTAVAIFLGAMAFLAFLGLAIIAFIGFQLRLWWLRRRVAAARKRRPEGPGSGPEKRRGRVIEGEYEQRAPNDKD